VALLQQALACHLCEFLVEKVLEHPDLLKVRDPASVKVHAIELLNMLTKDPGFGTKFKSLSKGSQRGKSTSRRTTRCSSRDTNKRLITF